MRFATVNNAPPREVHYEFAFFQNGHYLIREIVHLSATPLTMPETQGDQMSL
jgi:hypothetical protein